MGDPGETIVLEESHGGGLEGVDPLISLRKDRRPGHGEVGVGGNEEGEPAHPLGRERPYETSSLASAVEEEVDADEALHTPGIHSIASSVAKARSVAAT